MTRIELNGGKYTVAHDNGTNLHALRHGEPWRDLCGDGLILAMAQEIEDLRDELHLVSEDRDHAGSNSSAFEDRMGELQIENGKLRDQLEFATHVAGHAINRAGVLDRDTTALRQQLEGAHARLNEWTSMFDGPVCSGPLQELRERALAATNPVPD